MAVFFVFDRGSLMKRGEGGVCGACEWLILDEGEEGNGGQVFDIELSGYRPIDLRSWTMRIVDDRRPVFEGVEGSCMGVFAARNPLPTLVRFPSRTLLEDLCIEAEEGAAFFPAFLFF